MFVVGLDHASSVGAEKNDGELGEALRAVPLRVRAFRRRGTEFKPMLREWRGNLTVG